MPPDIGLEQLVPDLSSFFTTIGNSIGNSIQSTLSEFLFIARILNFINNNKLLCLVLVIGIYIFESFAYNKIANKLNHPHPWISWSPRPFFFFPLFSRSILLLQLSEMPWWWMFLTYSPIWFLLLSFFPFIGVFFKFLFWLNVLVNLIFGIIAFINILEKLGKPAWWVVWFIIPIVNLVMLGTLAFGETDAVISSSSNDYDHYDTPSEPRYQEDSPTVPVGIRKPGFSVLIAQSGPLKGQTYTIAPNGVQVIGRGGNIKLPVDDRSASREHARIRDENGKFVIYDLGSTNKTYVNSQTIERRVLQDGDLIKIGKTTFRFEWIKKH